MTYMCPLQYRAQFRLLEARRLIIAEDNKEAAQAIFRVGYNKPVPVQPRLTPGSTEQPRPPTRRRSGIGQG